MTPSQKPRKLVEYCAGSGKRLDITPEQAQTREVPCPTCHEPIHVRVSKDKTQATVTHHMTPESRKSQGKDNPWEENT
jgi:hypothetical protein